MRGLPSEKGGEAMSGRRAARHRRFADGAGFTRHCWECANATDWHGEDGRCTAYDMRVTRYDSPYNVCSKARRCCAYREQGKEKE